MSERTFDRETLLDLTVNIVPLAIILFFFIVFIIVDPWEFDPFIEFVSIGLLIIPFAGLALLTYVSGQAIEEAEEADSRTALDEPADTSIESGETEDDADDAVTALNDRDDTGGDDETDESADDENSDHADDESDADESAETDDDR